MELLTLAQTMTITGLPRRTLFRYRERGTFPAAVSLGHVRAVMFRRDQVEKWLVQHFIHSRGHRNP